MQKDATRRARKRIMYGNGICGIKIRAYNARTTDVPHKVNVQRTHVSVHKRMLNITYADAYTCHMDQRIDRVHEYVLNGRRG